MTAALRKKCPQCEALELRALRAEEQAKLLREALREMKERAREQLVNFAIDTLNGTQP